MHSQYDQGSTVMEKLPPGRDSIFVVLCPPGSLLCRWVVGIHRVWSESGSMVCYTRPARPILWDYHRDRPRLSCRTEFARAYRLHPSLGKTGQTVGILSAP